MRPVLGATLLALCGVASAFACAPRARMCSSPSGECPQAGICVAGRCQPPDAGMTPTIAEQGDAGLLVRRVVVAPTDVAWLKRGDGARAASEMPGVFTLGRDADGDAILLTRFSVPLAEKTAVIEAYLLLTRTDAVDSDPSPISLHAARIVDPWDSHALAWSAQPRTVEVGAASTRVDGASRTLVRLDVRSLVSRWAEHDRHDQGIAIVAESTSPTGVAFAFLPSGTGPVLPAASPASPLPFLAEGRPERSSGAEGRTVELLSPRLELYLK